MSTCYCCEVLTSCRALKEKASDIEFFLLNEGFESAFHQNPYVLLAEHRRNPKKKPWVLVVREDTRIVGVVAGILVEKPFNIEFSVFQIPTIRLNTLILTGSNVCFSKECRMDIVVDQFLNALKDSTERIDIVYFEQNQTDSFLFQHITKTKKTSDTIFNVSLESKKAEIISWHILKENYEGWFGSYGRKTKKRMSWELSRFKKRAPQPVLVERISSANQVHRFMECVEKIRTDMWQIKTFGDSGSVIFQEVAFFKTFARRKWLRSYLLTCDGNPVAYELAVQYGGELTFLERGYTQTLKKIGPGTYLTHYIIRDCYEYDSPKKINFGYGENEFKKRLRNVTADACCAFLTVPNIGSILVKCQEVLTRIEEWISNALVTIKLDQRVRSILKSK